MIEFRETRHNVYTFKHTVYVNDYTSRCEDILPDSLFEIDYTLSLMTPIYDNQGSTGTIVGYTPYPICDYNDEGDIFDCSWFSTIPCDDEIRGSCIDENYYQHSGTRIVECGSPTFPNSESGIGTGASIETATRSLSHIYPNPFSNKLIFSTKRDIKTRTISMYNSNGDLIKKWNSAEIYQKNTSISYDTNLLTPGLYVVQIITDTGVEIHKMIKQ